MDLLEAELKSGAPFDVKDIAERVTEMKYTTNGVIEILDDLLLYERLERNSVHLNIEMQSPLKAMRKVLKGNRTVYVLDATDGST